MVAANIVTDLLQIGIDFMKAVEIPVMEFGSISLWELSWGFMIVDIFLYMIFAWINRNTKGN